MGVLEDVLKALDRIPIWKRLGEVPAEVDDLKRRIAALEEKLGGRWPADVCKFCGERALRMTGTRGPTEKGKIKQHWTCEKCGQLERRIV